MTTSPEYPSAERKRSGYFARYAKSLFRCGAVMQFGKDPVMLALLVASREDRLHYNKPPMIWRAELMEQLGIGSPKGIISARQAAIDAGLIFYAEGSRTQPPKYWSLVPDWLDPYMRRVPKRNTSKTTRSELERETERKTERETERILEPITQYPPKGKKHPRFAPPSVDDVRAYCRLRNNSIDPDQFVDHYTANGWTQGKGKPIRDWQAAVRTWERNGLSKASPQPAERKQLEPMVAGRRQK